MKFEMQIQYPPRRQAHGDGTRVKRHVRMSGPVQEKIGSVRRGLCRVVSLGRSSWSSFLEQVDGKYYMK